ncbi:hypothetical protein Droror1_Dr00006887 [Drosera rotundifolia]
MHKGFSGSLSIFLKSEPYKRNNNGMRRGGQCWRGFKLVISNSLLSIIKAERCEHVSAWQCCSLVQRQNHCCGPLPCLELRVQASLATLFIDIQIHLLRLWLCCQLGCDTFPQQNLWEVFMINALFYCCLIMDPNPLVL